MDMKYERICNDTIELVREVGKYILNNQGKIVYQSTETKGKHNFVTEIDRFSEEKLIYGLGKIINDSGFIAEEGTNKKRGEKYNWIIDPLDGTTNYIHGAPPVAISVALMEDNDLVAGVVLEMTFNECFYAFKDSPSYLDGKEIRVSPTKRVKDSLIATGFPYHDFGRLQPFMQTLDYFFNNSHGVRRLGSAATDLAYVACGRYDAFYEYNLNPWDVAAGSFVIKQAGGLTADFKGGDNYLFGKEIVATNSQIFEEFLGIVGNFMNK
jgi:myo-inositol-1(or 4)-monophosphatase